MLPARTNWSACRSSWWAATALPAAPFSSKETDYAHHEDGADNLEAISQGPVSHRITLTTVAAFAWEYLRYDVDTPLTPAKWLTFPEQHLATLRYGPVFHDSLGELAALRQRLHYYPHDLWLYLLAGQWQRLGQEEPFVGRCGDVGDELGSRLIAARQVRNVMRLCFLKVSYFYERPYLIIHADRFADALRAQIQDTAVQALPPGLGGIDQLLDSTDVLSYPQRFARLVSLYQPDEANNSQP